MRNSDKNKINNTSYVNARGLHQAVMVLPVEQALWIPFQIESSQLTNGNAVFRIEKKSILKKYMDRTGIILRPEEIDQANRLRSKKARQDFIVSKLALRLILGKYLNIDPFSLRFKRNRWGKPALLNHNLHFNISHSDKWLLLATSSVQRVGIDLEQYILAFDYRSMVQNYFHPSEKEVLMDTYSWAQKTFFKLWTRKEALAKVIGLGLHERLLSTNMLETGEIGAGSKLNSFFVSQSFHVDNQHIASLALRNDVNAPIFYTFL